MKSFCRRCTRSLALIFVASNLALAVCPGSPHETTLAGDALSPDGTRIAAVAKDGAVFWWDVASGKRTQLLDCVKPADWQHPILFSPDSAQVAVAAERAVEVFDVSSGQIIARLPVPNLREKHTAPSLEAIYNIVFSADGQRLAASYETGAAVWDLNSKAVIASIQANPIRDALALNEDGRLLLLGSGDGVELWTLGATGSTRKLVENITAESVLFAHRDQWIVALTAIALPFKANKHVREYKREIGVWDRQSGKRLKTLQPKGPLDELQFGLSSGGPDFVLGSDFKDHLYAWDLETGALKGSWNTLAGHPSSDGKLLLRSGGLPGELELWEIGSPDSDARTFVYKSPLCAPTLQDANGKVRFDALSIVDGQSADDEPFGSFSNAGYVAQDCTPVGVSHLSYKTRERALHEMQRRVGLALEILDPPEQGALLDSVPATRIVLRVRGLTAAVNGFSILWLRGKSLTEIYSTSLPVALAMEKQESQRR